MALQGRCCNRAAPAVLVRSGSAGGALGEWAAAKLCRRLTAEPESPSPRGPVQTPSYLSPGRATALVALRFPSCGRTRAGGLRGGTESGTRPGACAHRPGPGPGCAVHGRRPNTTPSQRSAAWQPTDSQAEARAPTDVRIRSRRLSEAPAVIGSRPRTAEFLPVHSAGRRRRGRKHGAVPAPPR